MPESDTHHTNAETADHRREPRLRKDLLSWSEAKEECLRRLTNALPDVPALVIVIVMGGLGAALAASWRLSIGEKEFASSVSGLSMCVRMWLGCLGATVAVFLLAKTDTSKLIHCSLIAVLSGMAGPYLVTKALTSVGIGPELVSVDAGIAVVTTATEKLREVQKQPEINAEKNIDVYQQTAQSVASYLTVLKRTPENGKQKALARTTPQLQETLKVLDSAAGVAPEQSLSLLTKVAKEASDAGATEVANEARKIINTNSVVRAAADTAAKSGKVYFITPQDITDTTLRDLHDQIKSKYALADIQPAVHPTRRMDDGLEIVYYRDIESDKQTAEDLSKLVATYLKDKNIVPKSSSIRKGSDDQAGVPPFHFDIHLGPDIAAKFANKSISASTPSVQDTPRRRGPRRRR